MVIRRDGERGGLGVESSSSITQRRMLVEPSSGLDISVIDVDSDGNDATQPSVSRPRIIVMEERALGLGDADLYPQLLDELGVSGTARRAITDRLASHDLVGLEAEVEALLAQGLPLSLPAMRAHGVPELAGVLRGTVTLEEASRRAVPRWLGTRHGTHHPATHGDQLVRELRHTMKAARQPHTDCVCVRMHACALSLSRTSAPAPTHMWPRG